MICYLLGEVGIGTYLGSVTQEIRKMAYTLLIIFLEPGKNKILVRPTRKFQMDSDYDSKAIIIDSEQQFLGFTNDLLSYFILNTENETSVIEMKSMLDQTTKGQLKLADLSGAFSIRLEQYDSKFVCHLKMNLFILFHLN